MGVSSVPFAGTQSAAKRRDVNANELRNLQAMVSWENMLGEAEKLDLQIAGVATEVQKAGGALSRAISRLKIPEARSQTRIWRRRG